jgi:glycosyltransferase involved in cell wall biosynthesis
MSTSMNRSDKLVFSLIVCSINRVDELDRLFASLTGQGAAFNVILVDQNRDGRLDELVRTYEREFPLRRIFSEPGLSRARNEGLKIVDGDIVAFPDDDCVYPEGLLHRVSALFLDSQLDGVTISSRDADGTSSGPNWLRRPGRVTKLYVWRQAISYTIFLRRTTVNALNGFDPTLGPGSHGLRQAGEETEYLLRALDAGKNLLFEPSLCVIHPGEARNLSKRMLKAYTYGVGVGHVVSLHRFPVWFKMKVAVGPLIRGMLSMVTVGPRECVAQMATFVGRLRGLLS